MGELYRTFPTGTVVTTKPINDWVGLKGTVGIGPYKFDATLSTKSGWQGSSNFEMEALLGAGRVKAGGEVIAGDYVVSYQGLEDPTQKGVFKQTKAKFVINPNEGKLGGEYGVLYFQAKPMEGEVGAKFEFKDYFSLSLGVITGRDNTPIYSPELESRLVIGDDGIGRTYRDTGLVGPYGPLVEITAYIPTSIPGQYKVVTSTAQISKKAQAQMGILVHQDDTYTRQCFAADTVISTNSAPKKISNITAGDVVLSFDPFADFGRGSLVPKKVVRTFTNITEEWLRLTWVEDGEERELVTTPSHQFLAAHGGFREIESLVSGGKGRVVLADGSEAEVTSERIVYCAATADMFEQTEGYVYPENGNLALKPVFKKGWKTYNFEVEDFHTYVAGGVRVHNDSWNDDAGFEFQKEDYGTGNAYAITDLEGIVPVNGYAVTAYRLSQNSSYDSTPQGRAEAVAFGAAAEGASNRQVNAASWSEYKAKTTEGLSDKAAAAWSTAHWSAKEFSRFEASIKHGRDQGREVAKQINDQNDRNSGRDSEGSRADTSRSSNPADRGIGRGDYDNDGEVSAREFRRAENEGQFETGNKAKNNDSDGNSGGNGGSGGKPVLLDLDGDGLDVTAVDRSTIFLDTGGDGFLRRTAWADAGDGVLFYDPDGRDGITEKRQFVFTEWDPTATSDLEALASVFDSNSDGVLDAGDAEFGKFKVLVTLADGSTVAKTLAELGITAIDLTAAAANSDLRLAA